VPIQEAMQPSKRDTGFTLIELLIVVVILGVLATVTVFAVRGITHKSATAACAADVRTIDNAQEAFYAEHETYTTEDGLLAAGYLKTLSDLHDITVVDPDTYTLTPLGVCIPS
jgi:prepilin-type N-terminal cleavage/methylation domain-containing protein